MKKFKNFLKKHVWIIVGYVTGMVIDLIINLVFGSYTMSDAMDLLFLMTMYGVGIIIFTTCVYIILDTIFPKH